jgi:pectin methylesterase-like acyl-CoA thioesterase
MFFPGPKLNTLFASRWKALLWAGGVLLTAYCTVPSAEETAQDSSTAPHTDSKPATSPWARDPATAKPAQ